MKLEVPEKDLEVKIYSDGLGESGLKPLVLTIHLRNSELHVSRHNDWRSATARALAFLGEG